MRDTSLANGWRIILKLENKNSLQQVKGVSFSFAIRQRAEEIAAAAQHVKINKSHIFPYVESLLKKYAVISRMDEFHFLSEASPQQTASYVLALDSINFGSGYFHLARTVGVDLEYVVIAKGLKNAFLAGHMNTPEKWTETTPLACHKALDIPRQAHPALDDLMTIFAKHLRASGENIMSFYSGNVLNLIESAQGSAVKLAETIAAWPTFADAPLYKRAQIFAADIHLALQGRGSAAFRDIGELTSFADNMVPHVLRCDGILEYSRALAEKVDGGQTLEPGSVEELEIRAVALHAVELLKQAAPASGREVTSVNIDHILWNRGYEPEIYSRPSHRTMTVWY